MTVENLISKSLDEAFLGSNPRLLSKFKKIKVPFGCALFEVKGNTLVNLSNNPSINERRLASLKNFYEFMVKDLNLNCKFLLNTTDLDCDSDFSIFQFSKKESGSHHITTLDPHIILSWLNYKPFDTKPFEKKINKVVFRGTDTGSYPLADKNERIHICNTLVDENWADFKISKYLSYCEESLNHFGINKKNIDGDFLDIKHQSEYKYIADIYGNSVAWDRNLWAMGLNSILLKIHAFKKDKFHLWYSKFLDDENIVPNVSLSNLEAFLKEMSDSEALKILNKQLEFSKLLNNKSVHLNYVQNLLVRYNKLYNE